MLQSGIGDRRRKFDDKHLVYKLRQMEDIKKWIQKLELHWQQKKDKLANQRKEDQEILLKMFERQIIVEDERRKGDQEML